MPHPCMTCLTPLLPKGTFTLYDLSVDPFEENNLFEKMTAEKPSFLDDLKNRFYVRKTQKQTTQ